MDKSFCRSCGAANTPENPFPKKEGDRHSIRSGCYCPSCQEKREEKDRLRKRLKKRRHYLRNREKFLAYKKAWRLKNSDRQKELQKLWYLKNRHTRNKESLKKASKKWREANRAKTREMLNVWAKKNPNRMREKATRRMMAKRGAWTPQSRFVTRDWFRELCERQNNHCSYCDQIEKLQMDHVIPISRGGKHERGNILPVCLRCNASKRERLISEWKPQLAIPLYGLELASA